MMRVKAAAAAPARYMEGGRPRVILGRLSDTKLGLLYNLLNTKLSRTVHVDQRDVTSMVDELRAWREVYGDLRGLKAAKAEMVKAAAEADYEEAGALMTRIAEVSDSIKQLEQGLEDLYRSTQQVGK
jgi:hypothetical protein